MPECPSIDTLRRLVEGRLDEAMAKAISEHVEICSACQQALDAIPAFGESRSTPSEMRGYEILCELGRGGMGVVYKARQIGLNRLVALKMVLSGVYASQQERARFRTEAEAVARLQHPNIVQIYEIGEHEGQPFFSLEFCEGGSLAEQLDGTPVPARQAANLVETLAGAVHAAHQYGIVHRDLKPANILLSLSREPRANAATALTRSSRLNDAIPKITDFGLAKMLEQPAGQTKPGAVMGTPSYMAPEQAEGKNKEVGPAADTYALGAILYELLTGRPPFKAESDLETLQQVVKDDPVPVRHLQPRVPRDLETICMKCLQKIPAHRYESAQALAEDLGHFRRGEPIIARPTPAWERAWKWAQRHRAAASLIVVTLVGVLAVTGTLVYALIGWGEAREANREKDEQVLQVQFAQYRLLLDQAYTAWRSNEIPSALQRLDSCPEAVRNWEWYHLKGLCKGYIHKYTVDGRVPINALAFSPHGPNRLVVARLDGQVEILDAATWQALFRERAHSDSVLSLAFASDGASLLTFGTGGSSRDRSLLAGQIKALAPQPDGASLDIRDWWPETACDIYCKAEEPLAGSVQRLALSQGGKYLAYVGEQKTIKVCDTASGTVLRTLRLQLPVPTVFSLAFSPNGAQLAIAGGDFDKLGTTGTLQLWKWKTDKSPVNFGGHTGAVFTVAFSEDGNSLASGSADQTVRLWDVTSGEAKKTFSQHTGPVNCLAFDPRPKSGYLASVSGRRDGIGRGEVTVWDLQSGNEVEKVSFKGHDKGVTSLAWDRTGTHLATADTGGTVIVWDTTFGQQQRPPAVGARVVMVARPSESDTLTARVLDGKVQVEDRATGQVKFLIEDAKPIRAACFSPDGRRLVSVNVDAKVKLWDVVTRREAFSLDGPPGDNFQVSFRREGRGLSLVVVAERDGQFWGTTWEAPLFYPSP